MAKIIKKSLNNKPDETRTFEKGKVEVASLNDVTIGRAEFEPGWSWEKCVKPLAKTIVVKHHTPVCHLWKNEGYDGRRYRGRIWAG
jgi:hypothetical protein